MPNTFLGIGTGHFGKWHTHHYLGVCPKCRRTGILTAFDTLIYVVLCYLPVLPLGKRRMLDACEYCRYHRSKTLPDWRVNGETALAEAEARYQAEPGNENAAIDWLATTEQYQQRRAFDAAATRIAADHSEHPRVLQALAGAYTYFDQLDKAEETLRHAQQLRDDEETRYILAGVIARRGRAEEAAELFEPIIQKQQTAFAQYLIGLAESFQALGKHDRALHYLNEAITLDPALQRDRDVRQAQKLAAKHSAESTPVHSARMRPIPEAQEQTHQHQTLWARWAVPGVLIGLLAIYVAVAVFLGAAQRVWLVNGLSTGYDVVVNDKTYQLEPFAILPIRVPEGQVNWQVQNHERLGERTGSGEIRTSFWKRLWPGSTFVINPDGLALFLWEKRSYGDYANNYELPEQHLFTGEGFYSWSGLYHPFEPMPEAIPTLFGYRFSLKAVQSMSASPSGRARMMLSLLHEHGEAHLTEFIERQMELDPDCDHYIEPLTDLLPWSLCQRVIKAGLDYRPIKVRWHRVYQKQNDSEHYTGDLDAEYRKILAEDPCSSARLYLLGRVAKDPQESLELFVRATEATEPDPFSFNGACFTLCAMGRFSEAARYGAGAVERGPNERLFRSVYSIAALGAHDYEAAADQFLWVMHYQGPSIGALLDYLYCLDLAGGQERTQQALNELRKKLGNQYSKNDFEMIAQMLDAQLAYGRQDFDMYVENIDVFPDPATPLKIHLTTGEPVPDDAMSYLPPHWHYALLLYLHARHLDNTEQAAIFLEQAASLMMTGRREARAAAKAMTAGKLDNVNWFVDMAMSVEQKCILLTAMGVIFEEHREAFFKRAQALNIDRRFPYWFIEATIERFGEIGG